MSDAGALLNALLAASADCIKILDLDGHVLFMSESARRLMEVEDFQKVHGCQWTGFWPGGGRADAEAALQDAREGRTGQFRGYAPTLAGTPKWWEVTVIPVLDAAGKPHRLLSVSRDITARQFADAALRESEARFKTFAQAMPNQVWSATPDGAIDWLNDKTFEYSGRTFDELKGDGWVQIVHPDDIEEARSRWAAALAGGDPYETEFRLHRADGTYRWHLSRALPIEDEDGRITRWVGTNTDIEDQMAFETALIESQQRVEAAVEAADIGTWDFDPRTGLLAWDDRCYELFGLTPGKPVSFEVFLSGLHPGDRAAIEKACLDSMRPDNPLPYEVEYRTVGLDDGIERWVSAKGKGVFENGVAVRFIGTIRDISTLKQAQAQQQLLTRELEHRMKNMMAIIAAIANQTFRTAATKEEAQAIFGARLATLDRAHDALTRSSWTSASMATVVEGALAPHRTGEGRIHIEGPNLDLTAKQALSLALALHELATNAAKYGALSRPDGKVDVTWGTNGPASDPALQFAWRESGGPAVAPPQRRGFGSRLIESALSADFGGTVTIDFAPAGVVCSFETKLRDLRAHAGSALAQFEGGHD